jgi:hypothetical protein
MSIISPTIRICEANISRIFAYIAHQGHIHSRILHILSNNNNNHFSLFTVHFNSKLENPNRNCCFFFLDKCASKIISVVKVAVMSIPIQHIQKSSESTHLKWQIGCFLFMLPFLFTSTTQLSEVRINGRF